MIKVSIIIVVYKYKKELDESLRSIGNQKTKINYEVIIVNNGSEKFVKKKAIGEIKDVVYIKSSKNIGYGRGNSLGAKYANGKYLLILNPDIKLQRNVIHTLFDFIEQNKNAAVLAPVLVDKNGKVIKQISSKKLTPLRQIFTYTFMAKLFPKNNIKKDFLKENINSKAPYEVEVVPGSAFMIRKDVFNKLAGFDKNYFLYFEENDLFKRVREEGYKIYKVPGAKVFHDWKPSEGGYKLKKVFEKSRFYYFNKHYGLIRALIVELFSRKWWSF